jgi:VIT1/CCC1 family predicted Fe2+/Mn2+ transporter
MPRIQSQDTNKVKIRGETRRLKVQEMLLAGLSQSTIARRLNVSHVTISDDCGRILAALAAESAELRPQIREVEMARLDALQAAAWRSAIGTGKRQLAAIDRIIRIMERRARLLGLDSPTRIEIPGGGGAKDLTDDDLAAIIAADTQASSE